MKVEFSYLLISLMFFIVSCDQSTSHNENNQSENKLSNGSIKLIVSKERRGVFFTREISRICNEISGISNKEERVRLLGELADSMQKRDLSQYTLREKESMAVEFWLPLEQVAYQLVQNGSDEQFVYDFIIKSFQEYRNMCFSCGDSNDFSDGDGFAARERRRVAKGLEDSWYAGVKFWKRISISTIFYGHQKAARRFQQLWDVEFGQRD